MIWKHLHLDIQVDSQDAELPLQLGKLAQQLFKNLKAHLLPLPLRFSLF